MCLHVQWQSAGKTKEIKQQHIDEKNRQHTEVNTELEGTPVVLLGVAKCYLQRKMSTVYVIPQKMKEITTSILCII